MRIKKNGKVVNLTESDLRRIVKRVLNEQGNSEGETPLKIQVYSKSQDELVNKSKLLKVDGNPSSPYGTEVRKGQTVEAEGVDFKVWKGTTVSFVECGGRFTWDDAKKKGSGQPISKKKCSYTYDELLQELSKKTPIPSEKVSEKPNNRTGVER